MYWLLKLICNKILSRADIRIDGDRPWDVHVVHNRAYRRLIFGGVPGIADGFIEGDWDCEDVAELTYRVNKHGLDKLANSLFFRFLHRKTKEKKGRELEQHQVDIHYNLDPALFAAMCGDTRAYTCAYWKDAPDLNSAQLAKFERICKKVGIQAGDEVLEIGGNGSFAWYAAAFHKARVTNITTSREHAALADELCKGLPVTNLVMSFKELGSLDKKFRSAVSIGMFEAVDPADRKLFVQLIWERLEEHGNVLIHNIVRRDPKATRPNEWIARDIFPGNYLPSEDEIFVLTGDLFDEVGFFPIHTEEYPSAYYDLTQMAWWHNLDQHWPELARNNPQHTEQRRRRWKLNLQGCAGSFRAEKHYVMQWLYQKKSRNSTFPIIPEGLVEPGCLPREMLRGIAKEFWWQVMPRQSWNYFAAGRQERLVPVKLRPSEAADFDDIVSLLEEAGQPVDRKHLKTLLWQHPELAFVAEFESVLYSSQLIGVVLFGYDFVYRIGLLTGLAVKKGFQAKGVGGKLLQVAEAHFATNDCAKAILCFEKESVPTLVAYCASRGYVLEKGMYVKRL